MLCITSTAKEDARLTAIQIRCTEIMLCTAVPDNTSTPVAILSTRIRIVHIVGVACWAYLIGFTRSAFKIEQIFVTRTGIFDSTPTGIHCGRTNNRLRPVSMMNNHIVLTTQ